MTDLKNSVQDVISSPLGGVIASVGEGVAAAQYALDEASIAAVLDIYAEGGDEKLALLREIGYRPTFYALPETTGEIKVSLRLGQAAGVKSKPQTHISKASDPVISTGLSRQGLNTVIVPKMYATPVDAGYANRYGFSANISATLTFKIVPVPGIDGADELRVLPNLKGKTVAESRRRLEELGLTFEFVNNAGISIVDPDDALTIENQEPEAELHRIVRLGDRVILRLGVE